jgi:hypothetical protein
VIVDGGAHVRREQRLGHHELRLPFGVGAAADREQMLCAVPEVGKASIGEDEEVIELRVVEGVK